MTAAASTGERESIGSATIPTCTWWIDEPLVLASSNPGDEDLARLRAQGFGVAVSLLEESEQPPRYDRRSAALAGWSIHSIPVEEGGTPSLDQVREFTALLAGPPEGTKVLVHCESGLGRSAFMGAAYWIARGVTAREAIAGVKRAAASADWKTAERERRLREYEKLQRDPGTKRRPRAPTKAP